MKENEVIDMLRESFPESGLGDDAAVIPPRTGDILLAADAVVEGVHYLSSLSTISQAVQKVISSNVSDIYAMGGNPVSILLTAAVPPGAGRDELEGIIKGLQAGCRYYGIELSGGDTTGGNQFVFSIAIMGEVNHGCAVTRSGAAPGNMIALTGSCGGSAGGLLLLRGLREGVSRAYPLEVLLPEEEEKRSVISNFVSRLDIFTGREDIDKFCGKHQLDENAAGAIEMIKRHLVPAAARVKREDLERAGIRVTSMIDVSDGLGKDLCSICTESETGAEIDERSLPVPDHFADIHDDRAAEVLDLALSSGEEYQQIVTLDIEDGSSIPEWLVPVGQVTDSPGRVILRQRDGSSRDIGRLGYEHTF